QRLPNETFELRLGCAAYDGSCNFAVAVDEEGLWQEMQTALSIGDRSVTASDPNSVRPDPFQNYDASPRRRVENRHARKFSARHGARCSSTASACDSRELSRKQCIHSRGGNRCGLLGLTARHIAIGAALPSLTCVRRTRIRRFHSCT